MKKLLLPIFVALLIVSFKAETVKTITGIVTSKEDGKPLPGVIVTAGKSNQRTTTDRSGKYTITIQESEKTLLFSFIGFQTKSVKINRNLIVNVQMEQDRQTLDEIVAVRYEMQKKQQLTGSANYQKSQAKAMAIRGLLAAPSMSKARGYLHNTESYSAINENAFHAAKKSPLSTFSIDVDAASYSNVRRYINNGSLPPVDAVRIEEMINYFDYKYPQPKGSDPVNIVTEISNAPWNNDHKLVQIGLQGRKISTDNLPASNLVFLIDVSGSMNSENKLPLLVSSFKLLTDQLRPNDRVAIVVYAGNSGLVLPSTPGNQKTKIKEALNELAAGGSTAGGAGLELAYRVAAENFIKGGNNRIILATDGDFNVGSSSDGEMQRLIEEKRKSGVFLTTLGFGMGNYKDSKMEILANKGNGNYAYIDNINEARKVLIKEFGGTLFTIAKDVKLQIEFNPDHVQAYRLIGYENRLLNDEDFNDDKKDAGELGSGHTVTALYEIIPVGVKSNFIGNVDDLKYQKKSKAEKEAGKTNEMLTVKLRYKQPDGNESKLIEKAVLDALVPFDQTSDNYRFAAAVAEFGMLLRQSEFKQKSDFDQLITIAQNAMGKDTEGYRSEFLKLVKSSKLIAKDLLTLEDKTVLNEKN